MPRARLRDTFRVQTGIEVPGADPSKRLRGEFVELTEEELTALKDEMGEGGKFPDLSEENLDVDEREPNKEIEATEAASDLAAKHDIDLGAIKGTGADGRILKSDVQDHVS